MAAGARVTDPTDMADSSGDIRAIAVQVQGDNLMLSMTVQGLAAPAVEQTPTGMANRYYYHWLLDTDNNPATGRSNAEYEGTPHRPRQSHRLRTRHHGRLARRQAQRRRSLRPLGRGRGPLVSNFAFQASGSTLTAVVPLGGSRPGGRPDHRRLGLPGRRLKRLAGRLDRVGHAGLEGLNIASGVVSEPAGHGRQQRRHPGHLGARYWAITCISR